MITSLRIEDLALVRGGRLLFQGLSMELSAGQAIALTGPNGSGKTSLLRAIAGLIRPHRGGVRFTGPAGELEPEDARGRGLHILGHLDGLKASRRVIEELEFQVRWTGGRPRDVAAALQAVDLERLSDLEVRMLSAGQRRRLALARLIGSPRPLWLLDEPMAPLDAARRAWFGETMARHLRAGGMILAAVHDPLPIPASNLDLGGWA